ncbi:unnamed protein product [Gadus morhua 'NCC']
MALVKFPRPRAWRGGRSAEVIYGGSLRPSEVALCTVKSYKWRDINLHPLRASSIATLIKRSGAVWSDRRAPSLEAPLIPCQARDQLSRR